VFLPVPDVAKETIQVMLEEEAKRQCENEKRKLLESRNSCILSMNDDEYPFTEEDIIGRYPGDG
jgi:hypothetical protein